MFILYLYESRDFIFKKNSSFKWVKTIAKIFICIMQYDQENVVKI